MKEKSKYKKLLIFLFLVSLLIHLPLVFIDHEIVHDEHIYLKAALGIEETRNEGFVLLLKLFLHLTNDLRIIRFFLSIIASLAVFTVFYSSKIFFDEEKALLTTIFYIFNPFFIYYTSFILTETIYLTLMPLYIIIPYNFLKNYKHNVTEIIKVGILAILITLRYTLILGYVLAFILMIKEFGKFTLNKKRILIKNIFVLIFVSTLFLLPYFIINIIKYQNPFYFMIQNFVSNYSQARFSIFKLFAFLVTPTFLLFLILKDFKNIITNKTKICFLFWIILTAVFYNYTFTLFDTIRLNLSSLFAWTILASGNSKNVNKIIIMFICLGVVLSYLIFLLRFFLLDVSLINIY